MTQTKKPKLGKPFRNVITILTTITICFVGGLLNRVRGGFLDIPDYFGAGYSTTGFNVIGFDLERFLIFALPSGFLVGFLVKENKNFDPYYVRRAALGLIAFLMLVFTSYIDQEAYMYLGRDDPMINTKQGLFDWLIGSKCPSNSFGRRWAHDLIGLNLRGLVTSTPIGFWLFCCGYSWDFVFCGSAIGTMFSLSWIIPSHIEGFEQGFPLGEFLFGFWLWFCIIVVIQTYKRNPVRAPKVKPLRFKIIFYPTLFLIQSIMIGSCISQMLQKDEDNVEGQLIRYQTLLGILITTSVLTCTEVGYFMTRSDRLFDENAKKKSNFSYYREDEIQINNSQYDSHSSVSSTEQIRDSDGSQLPVRNANPSEQTYLLSKLHRKKWIGLLKIPRGNKPFRYFLFGVRIVNVLNMLFGFGVLIYVIIADRILNKCQN